MMGRNVLQRILAFMEKSCMHSLQLTSSRMGPAFSLALTGAGATFGVSIEVEVCLISFLMSNNVLVLLRSRIPG